MSKSLDFSQATPTKFKTTLQGDTVHAGRMLYVAGQDNVLGPGRLLANGSRGPRGQYFVANVRVGDAVDAPKFRWEVSRKKYAQFLAGEPITVFVNDPANAEKALYLGVISNVTAESPAVAR